MLVGVFLSGGRLREEIGRDGIYLACFSRSCVRETSAMFVTFPLVRNTPFVVRLVAHGARERRVIIERRRARDRAPTHRSRTIVARPEAVGDFSPGPKDE